MRKLMMVAAALAVMTPAVVAMDGGKAAQFDTVKMNDVLAAQSDEMKARYQYRHPKETLEFFGVVPGMTVADVLPGREWYSGILLPYLGKDGLLVGTDYGMGTWAGYQGDAPEAPEWLEKRKSWPERFTKMAQDWRGDSDAAIRGMRVDEVPEALEGKIDLVLMMRAAHLPNRFEGELETLVASVFKALKPGGVLGIVQHRAPAGNSDAWADGSAGYLKQSMVVAKVEAAGFKLEATSEINANPKDNPTEEDVVWRLPPTLDVGKDNAELKAKMIAVGESDRMTLKFRKPE